MDLNTPVRQVKGVGEKIEKLLNKLGVAVVADLLTFLPRDYKDFTAIRSIASLGDGEEACVCATVEGEPKLNRIRRNLNILKFTVTDGTGRLHITYFNQPYLKEHIHAGQQLLLLGRVSKNRYELKMDNPLMERGNAAPILPVYRMTAGLSQKKLRQMVTEALKAVAASLAELFPADFRREHALCEVNYAYENIHFPKDQDALGTARRRLAFEEMLLFAAMLDELAGEGGEAGIPFDCPQELAEGFLRLLPFAPTGAQQRVMREITEDYRRGKAQNRLIQGDVGCGKTMLAYFAMYICVKNGRQCAMMAPTELLARQHFEGAFRLFRDEGINIELLTGSKTAAQKRETVARFTSGQAHILFGTHALFYESVEFYNLGLVITDEQHRFGVKQRARLQQKGETPHILIMSATPIPRTLALILYGRADISVVDEMPPGRQPVKTRVVPPEKRKDMYTYLKTGLENEGQAFVVCPMIEKNEDFDVLSAEEIFEGLQEVFAPGETALLHGKMKPQEKETVMRRFADGETKLLVSTTVIEVGVNIPDAKFMVVENAERFGLAQLHQLRGRVGRGNQAAYCFLVSAGGEKAQERLDILAHSNDGFFIAQKDLELRGPGEFLGPRQNGVGDLYMANLIWDMGLIREAREIWEGIKTADTALASAVRAAALQKFSRRFDEITMN